MHTYTHKYIPSARTGRHGRKANRPSVRHRHVGTAGVARNGRADTNSQKSVPKYIYYIKSLYGGLLRTRCRAGANGDSEGTPKLGGACPPPPSLTRLSGRRWLSSGTLAKMSSAAPPCPSSPAPPSPTPATACCAPGGAGISSLLGGARGDTRPDSSRTLSKVSLQVT